MTHLWVGGIFTILFLGVFALVIVGCGWAVTGDDNSREENRTFARGILGLIAGVGLAPFWPVIVPVVAVWGFVRLVKKADLWNVEEEKTW